VGNNLFHQVSGIQIRNIVLNNVEKENVKENGMKKTLIGVKTFIGKIMKRN